MQNKASVVERTAPTHDGHGDGAQNKSNGCEAGQNTPASYRNEGHQRHDHVRPEQASGQKRTGHRVIASIERDDGQHKEEQQENYVLPLNDADRHRKECNGAKAQDERRDCRELGEVPSQNSYARGQHD